MYLYDNKTKLRLFNGINGEYWHLKGDEKKRAIYLIKHIDFNKLNKHCYCPLETEKAINLICYIVKCEFNKRYNKNNCRKAFKDYEIKNNDYDCFMISLAHYYELL